MVSDAYVHGFGPNESERLQDQAETLVELLHFDTTYPPGCRVLEAGCGVGAQTITLAHPFTTGFDGSSLTYAWCVASMMTHRALRMWSASSSV